LNSFFQTDKQVPIPHCFLFCFVVFFTHKLKRPLVESHYRGTALTAQRDTEGPSNIATQQGCKSLYLIKSTSDQIIL